VRSQRSTSTRSAAISEIAECTDRHELAVWATDTILESTDAHERALAESLQSFLSQQQPGVVNGRAAAAWLMASEPTTDTDGVELLTFHAAKGREFSCVVVAGVEAGLVPHGSATTPEAHAEEARLAYVALTRAADFLYVTSATRRKRRATKPSPFFAGIGSDAASEPEDTARADRPRYVRSEPSPQESAIDALRAMRTRQARALRRSPESILSDDEIRRIAATQPRDAESLELILGTLTARRLAPAILDALHRTPAT
jgi:DNA helicase-2/ATP-dependent DNA helicase PcrA